jgi:poly-gamma-glutamate capsule biosynthesis protein CapA/YwtB (metallophosphatase superfamily)
MKSSFPDPPACAGSNAPSARFEAYPTLSRRPHTMHDPACRLAAMGDIMLSRAVGAHFRDRPEDFAMEELGALLQNHDVVFANLENPVATGGARHRVQNPHVTFRCHPDAVRVLRTLGITAVSLANNHMLDYGPAALAETLETLDAAGIGHAGAGRDYEDANRPLLIEARGMKLALLAYVFLYSASTEMATRTRAGVSDHRIRNILPRIRELARNGYCVLVSVHWGIEYSFHPLPYQMAQARRMIDAGATLIIGHGPHYLQGIETYGNGRIVYSLGNCVFDEPFPHANRSFIYSASIARHGAIAREKIHPFHIRNHVPALVGDRDRARVERFIARLGRLYSKRSSAFWQQQNYRYFRDIMWRVSTMKSYKFLRLPPLSFYGAVGASTYARKIVQRVARNVRALVS